MAQQFNESNFDAEVLQSDTPVLVDFWAEWCGPCKMMGPLLDELSTEVDGQAKVGKVNVDECRDLAVKFGVRSIPFRLSTKTTNCFGPRDGPMNWVRYWTVPPTRYCPASSL